MCIAPVSTYWFSQGYFLRMPRAFANSQNLQFQVFSFVIGMFLLSRNRDISLVELIQIKTELALFCLRRYCVTPQFLCVCHRVCAL